MSKVIDERVVEMRFDNKDFESNVQTSLKTIDKLKDSLNFDESTRSVEKFQDSLKHFSLDDIGRAVEGLSDKFSWGNIFRIDLLNNVVETIYSTITGVFNKIKGELHLEDVDPISNMIQGWGKYAEKTQSVATIMAATGESMEYVNAQMEKLLYFTDETSYSFTDMAGNIGKFTANGVALETASSAMEGIATWAARSGQNAATASRVMYNLSQAIGMGALKLQDWKSVELANMGTKEFKEMAIAAGLASGTLERNAEGLAVIADGTRDTAKQTLITVENFRETLKEGWLDTDTLLSTLNEYGKAAELINELHEATGMYASEILELAENEDLASMSTEDFAEAIGISKEELEGNEAAIRELQESFKLLGSEEYAFSVETYKAAQEARTFGDAMAAVADAVSSGWMKTFELLFGGYDKAKVLWTDLAENLIEIFGAASSERNKVLEEANTSGWDNFVNGVERAGFSMKDIENAVSSLVETDAFNEMTAGTESFREAIESGKISIDLIKQAIDELPDSFTRMKEVTDGVTDNYEEMTKWSWELRAGMYGYIGHDDQVERLMEAKQITKEYAEQIVTLSERHHELGRELTKEEAQQWLTYTELTSQIEENIELTDDQRQALRELADELDKQSAQESFIQGLQNMGHIALEVFTQARDAIKGLFPPATADQLRKYAAAFERITTTVLEFITESKVVQNVVTALVFPFRVLADILGAVGKLIAPVGKLFISILTPIIGVIAKFGEWLQAVRAATGELDPFAKIINKVAEALSVLINFVSEVAKYVGGVIKDRLIEKFSVPFQKLINLFNEFKDTKIKALDDFINSIKNANVAEAGEKVISTFRGIYESAKAILAPIAAVFKPIKDHFDYLERTKRFSGLTTLQNVFETIRWTALNAIRQIEAALDKLGIRLSAVGEFFQPLVDAFNLIRDHFLYLERTKEFSGLTTLQNILETIRWTAIATFKTIRDKLKEIGIDITPVTDKIAAFFEAIRKAFNGLKSTGEGESIFTRIRNGILEGTSSLNEFIESLGITLPKALAGGGIALAGAGIIKFIRSLREARSVNKEGVFEKIINFLNPFSDTMEKVKTATSSFNLTSFAAGIGLLAGSLIALSLVPADRLTTSFATISTALLEFIGTIAAINKIMGENGITGTFRLVGIGLGMMAIAGSLTIFAKAVNALRSIDFGNGAQILKTISFMLTAIVTMGSLAKAAGNANFKLSNGLALLATASSLYLFGKVLESYNNLKIDNKNILKVFATLVSAVTTMGIISKVAGGNKFKLSNGLGLVAMMTSLYMFAGLVALLGHYKIATLVQGGLAVTVLGAVVAGIVKLVNMASSGMKVGQAVGAFVVMAGVLASALVFAGVVALLGTLDQKALVQGEIALAVIEGVLVLTIKLMNEAMDGTGLRKSISTFIMLASIVGAIVVLGAALAIMGVLAPVIALGCAALALIILEVAAVLKIINKFFSTADQIKNALIGIGALALFGLALLPMVSALSQLGKIDFEATQKNMALLGELLLAFLAVIGVATLVGGLATAAGPILLVGIGVVAGVFALFVGAITVLVKDLERLSAVDSAKAKEGLELVKEELNILTDLAREFQEHEGLFINSLGAAIVCLEFGKGLHELATGTFILGLTNAKQASESLQVVKEEIDMMIALGEQLAQNEGSFSKGLKASAMAFSFGVGLHGLANDTQILGLVNAENAKAAMEPLASLITMMIGLAETIGADPTIFGKALAASADMVLFGLGLLPLVGTEFLAGLANAENVTANMGTLTSLIDMMLDIAMQMGLDPSLYFNAKATAGALKEFGHALLPLVASEFLTQFVDADASSSGFEATKKIVQWLIEIADYFQGENSISQGAAAAITRMEGFAKSLRKLTTVDFFSQFVDADASLQGLKPVQAVVDMLISMVRELSATETMAATAEVAVEAVKTFASSLSDLMWTLTSGSWSAIDPISISSIISAIVDGLKELASIEGDISGVSAAIAGVGSIFDSLGSLSSKGGLFSQKTIDTAAITGAFKAIGESLVELGNTAEQADVGNKIMNSIVLPITNETNTVTDAILSMGQAMSETLASFEQPFYVDGNNLAVGFINGIYSRVQDSYDAGFQLASEAEHGTRDAGEIQSPSKVFTKLGEFIGEGFTNGIESKYGSISDAAKGMADRAISIVAELRERMQALLSEKENELRITPVVDMDSFNQFSNLMGNIQASRIYGNYQIDGATVTSSIQSNNIMPELKAFQEHLSALEEHIDSLQIVLDTGVLVGATSAKMDGQFGIMTMRRGRGN